MPRSLVSFWKRVATSGPTVDGRVILPQELREIAETYSTAKFNRAMQDIEDSEDQDEQLLNQAAMREKALLQSGSVVEIANCYPQALYYQRNEVTDESWYYVRVDFPHDGDSVKNTFTSGQLTAASEFERRLLGMAAGAMYTGSGQQLDKIMKDQLYGLKTVSTIDFIGYSKEHGAYHVHLELQFVRYPGW